MPKMPFMTFVKMTEKRVRLWLGVVCLAFLPFLANGQSFFGNRSLTPISVDKLSDEEILLFKKNFQSNNQSQPEALQDLQRKGMSEEEIRKMEQRLMRLNRLDEGDQLEMLSLQLLQLQDSLKGDGRSHLEMTALERLYALDSNVFGAELFRNDKMDFAPNLRIATPPTYRIGPDDEIEITVYGFQEFNKAIQVQPSGVVNIPYAGVVSITGLTLEEAKQKIFQQLSKNGYNTLLTGRSQLTMALKEIRSMDVTVVGGKIPGRYTVPAIASPYHVLHLAGGPAFKGSYRTIQLIRNGESVATIDLYELLANGYKHDDIRLEDGDVIFIPTYESRITLAGEFKRPRTFEIRPNESFKQILNYAGGFTEQAYLDKVYVERVGRVGFMSKVVDLEEFETFYPQNGDFIVADTLNYRFRNRISVSGGVQIPGYYAASPGLSLKELIAQAGGLREDAQGASLALARKDSSGQWSYRFPKDWSTWMVVEGDSIVVGLQKDTRATGFVNVRGEVIRPVSLPIGEGLSLGHALALAGGLTGDADLTSILIGRPNSKNLGFDVISFDFTGSDAWEKAFQYELGDRNVVTVRKRKDYKVPPVVTIKGEVLQEGGYPLLSRNESLTSVFNRAGGLTPYANPYGIFVVREINVDQEASEALKKESEIHSTIGQMQGLSEGGSFRKRENTKTISSDTIAVNPRFITKPRMEFTLQDGDEIWVTENAQTIRLKGAVFHPGLVSYLPNQKFGFYLSSGGGITGNGISSKAYVIYPNGMSKRSTRFLGLTIQRPKVVPGCTLVVPEKEQYSGSWNDPATLTMFTGVLTAFTTSFVGIVTLLRP